MWVGTYLGDSGGIGGDVLGIVSDGVGKDTAKVREKLSEGTVTIYHITFNTTQTHIPWWLRKQ